MAERMADGDLTCRVAYRSGEAGAARDGLEPDGRLASVDPLRINDRAVTWRPLPRLSSVSTQMISSAEETSQQASMVSSGSEQISRNVESVSVSVEQMIASIQESRRTRARRPVSRRSPRARRISRTPP